MNQPHKLTVTYLGPEGTYSEEAARQYKGKDATYRPEASIDEAIRVVEAGLADIAVVPIENSTEGAINSTYEHLLDTPLRICGELALPIHHQVLSKATSLSSIKEIAAHPQTLAQCRLWLTKHLPSTKQIAVLSNAEGARQAAKKTSVAAIASARAADIYKLPVLVANIEDDPSNTTRFIALGTFETSPTGADKTSLICSTPNKPGALYKVLGVFADQGINMVKLESRRARGSLLDYVFYIDIEGHLHESSITKTLELLKGQTTFLKILGSYPKEA